MHHKSQIKSFLNNECDSLIKIKACQQLQTSGVVMEVIKLQIVFCIMR